jgi:hypothetical protein
MMLAAFAFLRSPLGRYVLIGLAVLALCVGINVQGRHAQAKRDKPLIWNATTGKTWQSEAQRDAARFATCKANTTTLEASIASQNAAVTALGSESDRRVKMLADGLEQARRGRASAEARAAGLLKHSPVGIDACARSEAAARAVVEALQP